MKFFKQVILILMISLLAEGLALVVPIAIPSSVFAIVIMAALLGTRVLKEKQIESTADFLLAHMAIVFLPVNMGILEDLGILKGYVIPFFIILLISLLCTFFVSYFVVVFVEWMVKKQREGKKDA